MASGKIVVTREDYARLVDLLRDRLLGIIADRRAVRQLAAELQRARIVESGNIPADVVTMNSAFRVTDLDSHESRTYTLVYPHDANIADGKLSILTPMGIAVLGNRVGDHVRKNAPIGSAHLRLDVVMQSGKRDVSVA